MSVYGSAHVNFYVRFRPHNHHQLLRQVLNFLGEKLDKNEWRQAVDVGCGPGQCVEILAKEFNNVYGCDTSEDQIAKAKANVRLDNVHFSVGPTEVLPVADNSTDLVTCSQSMHWFDQEKFYPEVKRVLKSNGVLAAFGYCNTPSVELTGDNIKSHQLSDSITSTYNHPYLKQHWVPRLKAVDRCYRDIPFPFIDKLHREDFTSSTDLVASELIGYIKTWSDVHRCRDNSPA